MKNWIEFIWKDNWALLLQVDYFINYMQMKAGFINWFIFKEGQIDKLDIRR